MKITRISEALGKIDDELSREAVEEFERKSSQNSGVSVQKKGVVYETVSRKPSFIIAAASICAAAAISIPVINYFRGANSVYDNSLGAADSKQVDYSSEKNVNSLILTSDEKIAVKSVDMLNILKDGDKFVVENDAKDPSVCAVTVQLDRSKADIFAVLVRRDGTYEVFTDGDVDEEQLTKSAEEDDTVSFIWNYSGEGWYKRLIAMPDLKSWYGEIFEDKTDGDIQTSGFWFSCSTDVFDYVVGSKASTFNLTCSDDGIYSAALEYSNENDSRKSIAKIAQCDLLGNNSFTDYSQAGSYSAETIGIYGETEIPDIPCGSPETEGKAAINGENDALKDCLDSMIFEKITYGDYTIKLVGDKVRTDKANFPGSIYAQNLRVEVEKNGKNIEGSGRYSDTATYVSQFLKEYRLFEDKIGSYLDVYELEQPVIAMRYFYDDDAERTVTKAVEFAVIKDDELYSDFIADSKAGTGVIINIDNESGDLSKMLTVNSSDSTCRLSVFSADEFTVTDKNTLTDKDAKIKYTFSFTNFPQAVLYSAEKNS